jgi:hypothetical protein
MLTRGFKIMGPALLGSNASCLVFEFWSVIFVGGLDEAIGALYPVGGYDAGAI